MSNYAKLFSTILNSTVWEEGADTRCVWITMLAMADRDGSVESSVPGLARQARVTRAACETALAIFLAPDPDSRTKDHDGRRIEAMDGGWRLLNYEKYRDRASLEEKRAQDAARQKRKRERDRNGKTSLDSSHTVTQSHVISNSSPSITNSRLSSHLISSDLISAAEAEAEPLPPPEPPAAASANGVTHPAAAAAAAALSPEARAIVERIRSHAILGGLPVERIANQHVGFMIAKGHPLPWVLDAIDDCAAKAPDGLTGEALQGKLVAFMRNAKRPIDGEAKHPASAPPKSATEERAELEDAARGSALKIARVEAQKAALAKHPLSKQPAVRR